MAEKTISTRIIHKHDTEANWSKATNFTPKQGEIIIYDIDSTYNYERFKIGDGETLVTSLPFADGALKDFISSTYATKTDLNSATADISALETAVAGKAASDHTHSTYASTSHTHDDRYYTETEINSKLSGKSDTGHTHSNYASTTDLSGATSRISALETDVSDLETAVAGKSDSDHTHDGRYYTESEINTKLAAKADSSHSHSDYATTTALNEVSTAVDALETTVAGKANSSHNHASSNITVMTGYSKPSSTSAIATADSLNAAIGKLEKALDGKQASGNYAASSHTHSNYATTTALGEATTAIDALETSVSDLSTSVANKVDKVTGKGLSTNDYTTAEKNKLAGIATGATKVTVDSSLSSTSTNPVQNKVINSALSGKATTTALNDAVARIDAVETALGGKETSGAAAKALTDAKSYTDGKISDLLDGADDATLNSIKELADAIKENDTAIDALNTVAAGKADAGHTHTLTPATVSVVKAINAGSGSFTPTTKYLHKTTTSVAPNSHTHNVTVSGTTGTNSGTAVTVATGGLSSTGGGSTVATGASGTATVLTGVKASGTTTAVNASYNSTNKILTLTSVNVVTGVAANGTATAVTGVSTSKLVTTTVAPNSHTHSYGSSTALTTTANSGSAVSAITGLAANTTAATGDITYLESATHSHTGASVKSTETVVKTVTID